ncbi:P-type conjugative transfer protein TrbJ [Thioclava sp. BHET1]|nr:P-type conjugative transfer protein TrbJ [Thioclava sp. BHET1]
MRKTAMVSVMVLSLFGTTAAPVLAGPNPATQQATELTQLANKAELIKQVNQSASQINLQTEQLTQQINLVAGQLKAYQNMVENTKNLPQQMWGDVTQNLTALRDINQTSHTLAAEGSQLDTIMKAKLVTDPLYQSSALSQADYAARYQQWSTASQNALKSVLSNNQLTMKDVGTESDLINTIQQQGSTADGQVQAIQVGNELAASTARQIAQLRGLVASQNEQTSLYQARALSQQDADEAEKQNEANFKLPNMGTFDLNAAVHSAMNKN